MVSHFQKRLYFFWICLAFFIRLDASSASGYKIIELYESYGTYSLDAPPIEMHPIVLRIPEEYVYGSNKDASRNWGVNLLTYYPDFTSLKDPANARFGVACAGICNGRILISIANRTHSISQRSPNMGDFIARSQLKWQKSPPYPPSVQVKDIIPSYDFDEGFERSTAPSSNSRESVLQAPIWMERVFLKRAADGGHYEMTATCQVNHVRTTCILHFSLRCNPAIYVTVNGLDGSYLNSAADIREKTDKFISTMVRKPSCTA